MVRINLFRTKHSAFLLLLLLAVSTAAQAQVPAASPPPPVAAPRPGLVLEVPFHLEQHWIVLDIRAGKDRATCDTAPLLHFILDTGASTSLITEEAIATHKLQLGDSDLTANKTRVVGTGDADGAPLSRRIAATLSLRNAQGANEYVDYGGTGSLDVMPLGDLFKRLGVDGLLGDDIFNALVIEVDYDNRYVRLYDREKFVAPTAAEHFAAIPLLFRKSDGLPFIKASLTPLGFNTTDALLTLDTGSATSVDLYAPFVARHQWQQSLPRTIPFTTAGANGTAKMFAARLRDLTIGHTAMNMPQVQFAVSTKGIMSTDETDGQLGGKIFEHFTLIFDFANKMLYLRPHSDAGKPMATNWYFGIWFWGSSARSDGGYAIRNVDSGSPGERAGLQVGDVIYRVDGQKLTDISDTNLFSLLYEGVETRTFEVAQGNDGPHREVKVTGIAY